MNDESFRHDVEMARAFRGHGGRIAPTDSWEEIAAGRNLGKSVPISFTPSGAGQSLVSNFSEILRIEGRGDRADIARQVCVTIAPPQIVFAADAPDPIPAQIQGRDAVDLASTATFPNGGFSVSAQAIADDFTFINTLVKVEWGIGSVRNRAVVDCASGCVLNLVTSWLIVTGIVEQPPGTNPSPGVYILGANVGPGTNRANCAQRTIFVGNLANTVRSSMFVVPRFAKSVRVASGDGTAAPNLANGTIQFFSDPAFNNPVGSFTFNGNQTNPIPIPNGAYYFAVISGYDRSDATAPDFLAIFDLNI